MFEGKLARRYIGTQKRHSALTVCSITIALALITMLFSMFSTVISCLHNIALDQGAYHIQIVSVKDQWINMEQHNAIAEAASKYGTCTLEWIGGSGELRPAVNILLDKSVDSVYLFAFELGSEAGVGRLSYFTNDMLILLDMADAKSRFYMAAVFSAFYVFVLFLIMMLRLIIDTAFEISSKERERQFGVLQSIGATPKQIVRMITYEGLMLSVIGIPIGVGAGIGLGYIAYRAVLGTGLADLFLSPAKASELIHFTLSPWLLILGIVTGLVWVLLSAYGTGMRVIKMSPVQAISQRANTVQKVHKAPIFGKLFGWTGKLASRNNMRQPKRFIATVVSLTLSIALFSAVTVVVSDMRKAAEDYGSNAYRSDFDINYIIENDDPFGYLKPVRKLEESGLFANIGYTVSEWGSLSEPDSSGYRLSANVAYYSKAAYNDLFNGDPPVSYEELTESGGYILGRKTSDPGDTPDKVTLRFQETAKVINEEEYNALSPEEQEKCAVFDAPSDNGETQDILYRYTSYFTVELSVYLADDSGDYAYVTYPMVGTIDMYENSEYKLFPTQKPNGNLGTIYFDLVNDGEYYKAVDFLEENFGYTDNFAVIRRLRALLASINIVAAFLSIMIALIAVVNMVNILATGILNRRGELAALQCVGMTEKEQRKMTVIECLQYALTAGIAAVVVCELLMFLTEKMLRMILGEMEIFGAVISYVQPLPMIGIASLCAFLIAIAASVIPLRAMRKNTLVEQIRSVE